MRFELIHPEAMMWYGDLGLIAASEPGTIVGVTNWEAIIESSKQLVMVPSGHKRARPTCIFASDRDLGRVEVVYQHGYIWPMYPPPAGRAILEELLAHLNECASALPLEE
jgi:hypothetical protein